MPYDLTCMLYILSFSSGFLQFTGVDVSPVSYMVLVMSIGLMIDFILHMLIRYYEIPGSRQERVLKSLTSIGSSVLLGGLSTFLGVLMLAFSTSEVFRTVFRALVGLVVLGCGYGLILLPVVLSMIGPEDFVDNQSEQG
jgi:Niemann-Pick C1 protein